jgi:hypothetical protein
MLSINNSDNMCIILRVCPSNNNDEELLERREREERIVMMLFAANKHHPWHREKELGKNNGATHFRLREGEELWLFHLNAISAANIQPKPYNSL